MGKSACLEIYLEGGTSGSVSNQQKSGDVQCYCQLEGGKLCDTTSTLEGERSQRLRNVPNTPKEARKDVPLCEEKKNSVTSGGFR